MRLRLGLLIWLAALTIFGGCRVGAYTRDLNAIGFTSVGVVLNNATSSFVCLGPSAWYADSGDHNERWVVHTGDGSSAWQWAPAYGLRPELALTYRSEIPSTCDNASGITEGTTSIYPTGLYGAFVFWNGFNSGWNHRYYERPARAMPIGWRITGTFTD